MRRTSSSISQPVDAADELDVRRAPGRVRAHELLILAHGELDAGRSSDSGRCTMRLGTVTSSRRGSVASISRSSVEQARARQLRAVVVDLQRADARRQVDQTRQPRRRQRLHQQMHPQPQARCRAPSAHIRRADCRRPAAGRPPATGPSSGRCPRIGRAGRAGRGGSPTGRQRDRAAPCAGHGSAPGRPGFSWPIFQRSSRAITAGQTKPPRLGPSGPRMIGMSPVKSIAPMA